MNDGKGDISTKTYLSMDGHDDLQRIRKVLDSIASGGAGAPDRIQCVVEADGFGLYNIKDIRFNNHDRSVRIHIDASKPIEKPDYGPDTNNGRMLYPRRQDYKKQQ